MSDTDLNVLREDIAFLKRLSGDAFARPAPALWLMAVFGLGFGTSFLTIYALALTVVAGADRDLMVWGNLPLALSLVAFLGTLAVFAWRTIRRPADAPPLSRAARSAWTAAFLGLVVIVASFKIFGFTDRHLSYTPGYAEHLLPAVLLTLWGAAWWVAGFASDRPWARLIGPTSFAAALTAAWQANTLHMLLIGGLSLVLLMAAPAIALLREPRAS